MDNNARETASQALIDLHGRGAILLPIVRNEKRPVDTAWTSFTTKTRPALDAILAHFDTGGLIGFIPESVGIYCLDGDIDDPDTAKKIGLWTVEKLGDPLSVHHSGTRPHWHSWRRADTNNPPKDGDWFAPDGWMPNNKKAGEIIFKTKQAVLYNPPAVLRAVRNIATAAPTSPNALKRPPSRTRRPKGPEAVRNTAEGDRNSALFRNVKDSYKAGEWNDAKREEFEKAAQDAGLGDEEIRKTIESALNSAAEQQGIEQGKPAAGFRKPGNESNKGIGLAMRFINDGCELFHHDGKAYGRWDDTPPCLAFPIDSPEFANGLMLRYMDAHVGNHPPSEETIKSARKAAAARALLAGEEKKVHHCVAFENGTIYIDLRWPGGNVIKITDKAWSIETEADVLFVKQQDAIPLCLPIEGGDIKILEKLVRVKTHDDLSICASWLLGAIYEPGPYPGLILTGEKGSTKTTAMRALRSIVDPRVVSVRALPRKDVDFAVATKNAHVLAFDNISNLQDWQSDILCGIATEGAFTAKKLYTNEEETAIKAKRPFILNGIDKFATRADLLDRCVTIELDPVPPDERLRESEFAEYFKQHAPQVLGALLDAAVVGLRNAPTLIVEGYPRMADWAHWSMACEPGFISIPKGTFIKAHGKKQAEAGQDAVDAMPIATAIQAVLGTTARWEGTTNELLQEAASQPGSNTDSKSWPKTAQAFGRRFARIASTLREVGIHMTRVELSHRERRVILQAAEGEV